MYVGDDTRTMTFVLREVMHMHTSQLPINTGSTTEAPGQIFRIIANPLRAMLKRVEQTSDKPRYYQINTLGMTASRWREIRYVGTRVQFVPLATTGRIDPADITQSGSGVPNVKGQFSPQGSVHPYDALNFIHWRRWTGGNFNIPAWSPVAAAKRDAYVDKSLTYDQEWLSDDRFNHAKLTDGFSFDAVPLRVDLETSALAGNSLFGFSTAQFLVGDRNIGSYISGRNTEAIAKSDVATYDIGNEQITDARTANYIYDWHQDTLDSFFQPQGLIAPTAGKDYHEQGWLPNPFAGFTYSLPDDVTTITPGNEIYNVSGYIPQFPWFADRPDISSGDQTFAYIQGNATESQRVGRFGALAAFDLNYLINLCIERFIAPIGIVRLPPAYGSMFYWTAYMAHVFQLRKPFLTNSAWTVGLVQNMAHDVTPVNAIIGDDSERRPDLVAIADERIYQAVGPDPYGLAESPSTMSLCDVAPHMMTYPEPRYVGRRVQQIRSDAGDNNGDDVSRQAAE